jgi:predicted component of viral defense system (DUF524 family)
MSYLDICIIGWNFNALMFVVNFLIAIRTISVQDRMKLQEESLVLKELKDELEKYYPYRTYSTLFSYLVPFTAFFRMGFRLVEMVFFFQKNQEAKMFDYMVYKYSYDIQKARNNAE